MIKDMYVEVKIHPTNRKKYEEKLGESLINGEIIVIKQVEMLETSRSEVECLCDFCKKTFSKKRVNLTGVKTFCDNNCRNEYLKESYKGESNPNPKKDKVNVSCHMCKKSFEVFESKFKKQDLFLCSRQCYKEHRSVNYSGKNTYNYHDIIVSCETCGKDVETSKWYVENKNHIFCTQECYWQHRKHHYREFYYKDDLNNARAETKPERMVREWLEKNSIKYKQECGFLKKYYVDFYLPNHKMIIEVNGDYWHVNPDVYDLNNDNKSKKPLHDNQKEFLKSKRDEERKAELESYGYKVNILWEKDIYDDLEKHISKLFNVNINK